MRGEFSSDQEGSGVLKVRQWWPTMELEFDRVRRKDTEEK